MSLGINTLMELLKKAAQVFAPAGFDMEIVEKHHNQKLDAPSGTALALADSMNEALDEAYTYTYDRSQKRKKRDKYEIGLSSVRGGNIVGETGLVRPGEYVKEVSLSRRIPCGTPVNLKIMGYEPETYKSAGAVTLSTIAE